MSNPFFSVIIPAHNAENHIRKLLDSIACQHFRDYELIVICDNCTDSTEEIAREYGAITESVSFGRDGLARDRGIEIASGEWILFADDDDWFLHEYCFTQLADVLIPHGDNFNILHFGCVIKNKGYKPPEGDELFTPRIAHVWTKAWSRDAILDAGARFGDATFCSDTYFLKAMREHSGQNYSTLNMPIYYYNFMRHGSQTDLFCKGIIHQSPVAE